MNCLHVFCSKCKPFFSPVLGWMSAIERTHNVQCKHRTIWHRSFSINTHIDSVLKFASVEYIFGHCSWRYSSILKAWICAVHVCMYIYCMNNCTKATGAGGFGGGRKKESESESEINSQYRIDWFQLSFQVMSVSPISQTQTQIMVNSNRPNCQRNVRL